jgi:glycosyltransferase involved in cell wall biosynthesis
MSVSVVIAAYNVQECIPRALESATSQSIRPEEILVIDDGLPIAPEMLLGILQEPT